MPTFLHGVETVESTKGPRPITVVRTAVIGLIGVAPSGAKNTLIQVTSDTDAAQFGAQIPGFTIPQALEAILNKGAGLVLVVNVYDAATNNKSVASTALPAVAGRKTKTAEAPLADLVVTNNAGDVTYVLNTDYTVDAFGNITILSNTITEGTVLKAAYKALDVATITNPQIIGTVDGTTGARTGLKVFELAFSTFGFNPKILIAPGFSSIAGIATELIAACSKYRAITYIDAPAGITPTAAIAGRGPAGTINFNTSSKRAALLYPMVKVSDPNPGNAVDGVSPDVLSTYSAHIAGLRAAVDETEGYWVSESNHEILGITGVERQLTSSINDPATETNQLNAAGIITIFNNFGSGRRAWGNRSAAYPSSTAPDNFISIRRVVDIVADSVELAQMPYIDQPLNFATLDAIRGDVNSFIRTLVGRGALIDGECYYDPADNPVTELAAGHATFTYELMPPPPLEKITFKSVINTNLLRAINQQLTA
jgi:phage tail sheath protein FI